MSHQGHSHAGHTPNDGHKHSEAGHNMQNIPTKDRAGEICDCKCHGDASVKHATACCKQCEHCKHNIKSGTFNSHVNACKVGCK